MGEKRRYLGLNSHMMLLTPSNKTFDLLIQHSQDGEYVPYTNTDQDILEFLYPAHLFATDKMEKAIPHEHFFFHECMARQGEWASWPKGCTDEALMRVPQPTCDDFWKVCAPRFYSKLHS